MSVFPVADTRVQPGYFASRWALSTRATLMRPDSRLAQRTAIDLHGTISYNHRQCVLPGLTKRQAVVEIVRALKLEGSLAVLVFCPERAGHRGRDAQRLIGSAEISWHDTIVRVLPGPARARGVDAG